MQFISELKLFFLDSLFPYRCLLCFKEGEVLCTKCNLSLKPISNQFCIICHKPSFSGLTHNSCKNTLTPDGSLSMFSYKDIDKLIIDGKYNFISRIFEIFGIKLADFLISLGVKNNFENFIVTSLPLSNSRLRWRGFNQSHITASSFSSKTNLTYKQLLLRDKHKKSQKDLSREERKTNVLNAFQAFPGAPIKNQDILLIDDVVTTGFTLREAVKTLKQNGANEVWCLTIAKD